METIVSPQNPLVKHMTRLRKDRRYREEHREALIVGENLIADVAKVYPIKEIFRGPTPLMRKITGLENPEGVAAIVALPEEANLSGAQRVLLLDRITDPGNMGTLLRTALALGFDGAYLRPGCVDPYNEKALRAAKGATFSLPLSWQPLPDHFHLYLAAKGGTPTPTYTLPMALALGNEAQGLDPALQGTRVGIPIATESLNVAVAGGILMREMACAK